MTYLCIKKKSFGQAEACLMLPTFSLPSGVYLLFTVGCTIRRIFCGALYSWDRPGHFVENFVFVSPPQKLARPGSYSSASEIYI